MPAIIQDCQTGQVLMMGYMTKESIDVTLKTGFVTFYSRTRQKLWTKGEESGNHLRMRSIACDCDKDTLLVLARPEGPTCHRGTTSCFDESPLPDATSRYVSGNPLQSFNFVR
ncbi:MAG: phosphoribosyl-AMP cyclohydrolase [Aeromonadales bacterium]|nr:phosphoribosyl-AMP cyclohydrolase [Aeromonadales bacterium]